MVVQWLRLCAPNAGGLGSIRGQGTRSHMPQLKILHAAMKTEDPKYCNLRPSADKQINNHKWIKAVFVITGYDL